MKLEFNREQLLALMKDFHVLSGIRIVLFDDEYNELMSYPENNCAFCSRMKADPRARRLCAASDEHSFRRAEAEGGLIIYHCHAGLIEATIPLVDGHIIIGYLMFGQISGDRDRAALARHLGEKLEECDLETMDDPAEGIPLRSDEQIHAAAKIMKACTLYALFDRTIALKSRRFVNELRAYLEAHLSEALDSAGVARAMGLSRSGLYQQCRENLGMGVAEYLRKLRLSRAQELLLTTEDSISRIASRVGFGDYNYFCRVFRHETGVSPMGFRRAGRDGKGDKSIK